MPMLLLGDTTWVSDLYFLFIIIYHLTLLTTLVPLQRQQSLWTLSSTCSGVHLFFIFIVNWQLANQVNDVFLLDYLTDQNTTSKEGFWNTAVPGQCKVGPDPIPSPCSTKIDLINILLNNKGPFTTCWTFKLCERKRETGCRWMQVAWGLCSVTVVVRRHALSQPGASAIWALK